MLLECVEDCLVSDKFEGIVAECSFRHKFSDFEEIFSKINEVIWLY